MRRSKIKMPDDIGEGMSYCPDCQQVKTVTDFQKCKARANGLQLYCRRCQNIRTLNYRQETEGAYWKHRENDPYYVYQITNPVGEAYVGYTATTPNLRWNRHRAQYKWRKAEDANNTPIWLLHKSFNEYGIDTHTFQVLDQTPTKTQAKQRETELILRYKQINKSLNKTFSVFRVGQYDRKTGLLIKEWESIDEASKGLGFKPAYIWGTLLKPNRRGRAKGYLWKILPFTNGYFYDPRKK